MVDLKQTEQAPKEQFFEQVDEARAGMLGVPGLSEVMQPMSPRVEKGSNKLWFFLSNDSELYDLVQKGQHDGHFALVGKNHDYHATALGPIKENKDPSKVEEFWDPIVEAWFEGGKDDPKMTLMEMDVRKAHVWASTDSKARFGWEIAKANLRDEKVPDVGVRTEVRF